MRVGRPILELGSAEAEREARLRLCLRTHSPAALYNL